MGIFDRFRRPKPGDDVRALMKGMALLAFPGGPEQIESESDELFRRLRGSIPRKDVKDIHCRTKFLMLIGEDNSEERIVASIIAKSEGRFSRAQARTAYDYINECLGGVASDQAVEPAGPARPGAIVINNRSRFAGIGEEYAWIEAHHGKRGVDWELVMQMHQSDGDRSYDVLVIRTTDGREVTITFDITAFDRPSGRGR